VSAISCDANATEPDFVIHGLGLNPYRDGQGPGSDIEPNQVREMLETIAPYTRWIRSYGATHGLEEMATEANKLSLDVAMGIWVRHEVSREAEINNMIDNAKAGCVDIVVVGNEDLYAYEEGYTGAIDPCTIRAILEDVHSRLDANGLSNIPVTIAEPWYTLFRRNPDNSFKYQAVLDKVDVFMVNIYPFHDGIHIDDAMTNLDTVYHAVVADANEAGPNKPVIIGETGWPSKGEREKEAKPSPLNAARYFHGVQCWAARNDVNVFYFAAYDEKWKSPPEYAAHWGVWESDGTIKSAFLPSVVFCEDFDLLSHQFCAEPNGVAWEPNVIPGDSNSDGNFLRILYDGSFSHFSSAAFDRTAEGPFDTIVIQFDFRMYSAGNGADGFSVLLIPTSINGQTGCQKHGSSFNAEQPLLRDTFGVGFEICKQWPCSGPDAANRIYISWDMSWYPGGSPIEIPVGDIDLNSGKFHRARIEICCPDGNTALVNVGLTPNIYDTNHPDSIIVAENVVIGKFADFYKPYESRIEFAGRNGGLTTNADIDNIYTSYAVEFCDYSLDGDIDGNCRTDLFDLAIMAQNWLIDCRLTPGNPACVTK
jgi:exo-beta-1,3-glucanase (GH17 family)